MTPPSTRNVAPAVAEACGEQTNTAILATSTLTGRQECSDLALDFA